MEFQDIVKRVRAHREALTEEQRRELAAGQQPTALFITCSDSRVIPSLITGTNPGTLFELRTAGNIVPRYDSGSASSEMATVEYAVLQLEVPEIVVCAHSHCGAVTAMVKAGQGLDHLPALCGWLGTDEMIPGPNSVPRDPAVRDECKQHVLDQLDRLAAYPFIDERVRDGRLSLHGWFYEIDTGQVWTAPETSGGEFQLL